MKLNKAQQKRIKRAVQLSEWSYRLNTSDNSKTAKNGLRAVIWRG